MLGKDDDSTQDRAGGSRPPAFTADECLAEYGMKRGLLGLALCSLTWSLLFFRSLSLAQSIARRMKRNSRVKPFIW